ncbi:hypothetical protein [Streptomyces phaeoluteigriseus]|uniref:hypothetical protein n=1 Tax=Streptomyces phaeoluteigriseus TaxID=114686 RepID=UPI00338F466D
MNLLEGDQGCGGRVEGVGDLPQMVLAVEIDALAAAEVGADRDGGVAVLGVSSIGANGRLHFRGGHGLGTAPHRVTRITRPGEDGYLDQLHLAREHAAAVQSNRLGLLEPRRRS